VKACTASLPLVAVTTRYPFSSSSIFWPSSTLGVSSTQRITGFQLRGTLQNIFDLSGSAFPSGSDHGVDIVARVNVSDRPHVFVCDVKPSGQPRHVRTALFHLRNYVAHFGSDATPIFIAPYLSPEAQGLCRQNEVGFLDLEGNARIVFDGVFIERLVSSKPAVERRGLKSLFKPKSARVLRVMLRDPARRHGGLPSSPRSPASEVGIAAPDPKQSGLDDKNGLRSKIWRERWDSNPRHPAMMTLENGVTEAGQMQSDPARTLEGKIAGRSFLRTVEPK
jgi:hypothetical protein